MATNLLNGQIPAPVIRPHIIHPSPMTNPAIPPGGQIRPVVIEPTTFTHSNLNVPLNQMQIKAPYLAQKSTKAAKQHGPVLVSTGPLSSRKDQFGWAAVDNVQVPYIMRGNVKFVSVKMVENKLLSKFPKINMEDMNNVGPIYSYYVTDQEAKLLTEINAHCNHLGFGAKSFSNKDLIVSLENFENFYNRAKDHFSKETNPSAANLKTSELSTTNHANAIPTTGPLPLQGLMGGWVQINNTVVPYVLRTGVKFVPLSVIKFAAGLLSDVRMDGFKTPITETEFEFINNECNSAGVNFTFSLKTKLIRLELVIRMSRSKVVIIELPPQDPFTHALYDETDESKASKNNSANNMQHFQPFSNSQIRGNASVAMDLNKQKQLNTQLRIANQQQHRLPMGMNPLLSVHNNPRIRMANNQQLPIDSMAQLRQAGIDINSTLRMNIPLQQLQGLSQMPPRNPFIQHGPPNAQVLLQPGPLAGQFLPNGRHVRGVAPTRPAVPGYLPSHERQTPSPHIGAIGNATATRTTSSASCSRPSSAQSRSSNTPPAPNSKAIIKSLQFEGKTVSCLLREGEKEPFALLEALVRLYFPQCSLTDFQSALEQVLNVPIHQLTSEEEAEFIRFYGLKVKSLRCKSIVSFVEFQKHYTKLKYVFDKKSQVSPAVVSKVNQKNTTSPIPTKPTDIENNNNTSEANDEQSVNTNGAIKRKQSMPTTVHSRKSKQPKRLEDTVAKLKQKQDGDTD